MLPPAQQWNKQMAALAWRLHPVEAIKDLSARAADPELPAKEREAALTALAFTNHKDAAEQMVLLSNNKLPAVAEQAKYWLSFRQSNDWYNLLDYSKLALIHLMKESWQG